MPINDVLTEIISKEGHNKELTPYLMFKYAIKTEITRKYYERRLKKFFDFIEFEIEDKDIEFRCNKFAEKAKDNPNWTLSQLIRFFQYQKERVENKDITSGTLKNFVKSLKVYCEMADISIPWKKITRGLPNARQSANDRAPTIDEIKKLLGYPDRRIKPIVYTMISSGIRLGRDLKEMIILKRFEQAYQILSQNCSFFYQIHAKMEFSCKIYISKEIFKIIVFLTDYMNNNFSIVSI